jgi:hypothetical protein
MRKTICLLLLIAAARGHAQAPACTDCSPDATLIASQLATMSFDCHFAPVSVARGYRCRGRIAGYSQPVNIYVPPSLHRDRVFTIAYYFHGFTGDTAPDMTYDYPDGDFASFVAASGKNVVLVIPESLGKDKTYAVELGTAAKWNDFLTHTEGVLAAAGLTTTLATPRLVSGHSGAYVQLAHLGDWAGSGASPALKSLRGVGLFDTNYGYRAGIVTIMDVACRNGASAALIAFNPKDGSTAKRDINQRINSELAHGHKCAQAQVLFLPDSGTVHWQFPRKYMTQFLTAAAP